MNPGVQSATEGPLPTHPALALAGEASAALDTKQIYALQLEFIGVDSLSDQLHP